MVRFDLPDAESNYSVELYNTIGQLCYKQALGSESSIDIHSLNAGVYLLRLTDTKSGITYQNKIIRSAN